MLNKKLMNLSHQFFKKENLQASNILKNYSFYKNEGRIKGIHYTNSNITYQYIFDIKNLTLDPFYFLKNNNKTNNFEKLINNFDYLFYFVFEKNIKYKYNLLKKKIKKHLFLSAF